MGLEPVPPTNQPPHPDVIQDYFSKKHIEFLLDSDTKYLYWDKFKYQADLPYDDPVKAWQLLKLHRRSLQWQLGLGNMAFRFYLTNDMQRSLHEFDLKLMGNLQKSRIAQFGLDEKMAAESFIEESIASSQIEGAATTTDVARAMLKAGKQPRNESEQMIFNNLRCLRLLLDNLDKPMTETLILEIHERITEKTEAASCAGYFRRGPVHVVNHVTSEVVHTPPDAQDLPLFITHLFDFINRPEPFVHPIAKAAIIHFFIGYIHPFSDGNGRTARALFYWYLLKHGYEHLKHISISKAILESRNQYDKSYLYTEHDENDLNYFIKYALHTLQVSFKRLEDSLHHIEQQQRESESIFMDLILAAMPARMSTLIASLYAQEIKTTSIQDHAYRNEIVRQTARRDLEELVQLGLLTEMRSGRNLIFRLTSRQAVDDFISHNAPS